MNTNVLSRSLPRDAVLVSLADAIAQCDPGETYHPWVWIEGELSDVKRARSGHIYMRLSAGGIQIPAVVWERVARGIATPIQDGLVVAANGWVQPRPDGSSLELDVRDIVLLGHRGPRQLATDALRAKLQAEGLTDPRRKRALPVRPSLVGLVTSPTGDVVHDVMRVIERAAPQVRTELAPARVTGEGAAAEIASAIRSLSDAGRTDVVIVARGGGSSIDLAAYDTETVARAVAECRVPVIAAIGHESDHTLVDLVADLRCATPSEAAELAVRGWSEPVMALEPATEVSFRAGGSVITVRVAPAG